MTTGFLLLPTAFIKLQTVTIIRKSAKIKLSTAFYILSTALIILSTATIKLLTANNILASEKLFFAGAEVNRKQFATAQGKAHLQSAPPNAKPKIAKELFPFPLLPTLKKRINFLHFNPKDQPIRIDGTAYNKSFARLRGKVLNSSLLLIFELWCLTESFGILSPQPRKAPKRYMLCFLKTPQKPKPKENNEKKETIKMKSYSQRSLAHFAFSLTSPFAQNAKRANFANAQLLQMKII